MISRSFYFLRHGETDWNKIGRLQGHTDIPLNEMGREQARSAIPILKNLHIDRIIVSSLSRAYETAVIINHVLQKPIEADDRLKEKCFGIIEGKTSAEADQWKQDNPELVLKVEPETGNTLLPGMEKYADFHARIIAAKNEALEKYPDENLLFVSHGAVYRALCRALALELTQSPNAQPFHFQRHAPMVWKLNALR